MGPGWVMERHLTGHLRKGKRREGVAWGWVCWDGSQKPWTRK